MNSYNAPKSTPKNGSKGTGNKSIAFKKGGKVKSTKSAGKSMKKDCK